MIKRIIDSYHIEHYCDFCGRMLNFPDDANAGNIVGESPFGDLRDVPFECCDECIAKFEGKDSIDVINEILHMNIKYQFEKGLNYYKPMYILFYDKERKEKNDSDIKGTMD